MASQKTKVKGIAPKHEKFAGYEPAIRPSVKIMKCIGFQKFRYCGENRPGKKYQDKDFMQLALCHMSGKSVCIQIVCFDAERQKEIHPNGLVGKDCQSGVYSKSYPISKTNQIIRIPYLRTERILTKKTNKEGPGHMKDVFSDRAKVLPSPFKERCESQAKADQKYDTTRVCFGVIATIEESSREPLFCLSNVVQNASEKTMLKISKLSTQFVSAQEGGEIDIFTSEDGPPIIAGKCSVKVIIYNSDGNISWESQEFTPTNEQILYKRVVTYRVPAYGPNPATDVSVRGVISLSCTQSGQTCVVEFCYEPGADSARRLATIHSNKPLRKRPYMSETVDEENSFADIKWRMKEKLRSRQNQGESLGQDLSRPESAHQIVTSTPQPTASAVSVSNGLPSHASSPMASGSDQDMVPLHQQDDIVLAKDMVTGQVVYIRTPQNHNTSQDFVVYLQDGLSDLTNASGLAMLSEASRAVSAGMEWGESVATSSIPAIPTSSFITIPSSSSSSVMTKLEPVSLGHRSISDQAGPSSVRKKPKFVSPWIVGEPENTPMVNGDISFSQSKVSVSSASSSGHLYSFPDAVMKCEPMEMGPPILTPGQSNVQISSETVPGMSHNLPSGTLISNLPSLGSLLNSGVLEGVKFDDSGTLLSSSVFEMVRPYM